MADRPPAVAARTSRSLSPTGKNWRLWCPKLPAAPANCGLRTAVSADSVTVATLYGRRPFAVRAVLGPGRARQEGLIQVGESAPTPVPVRRLRCPLATSHQHLLPYSGQGDGGGLVQLPGQRRL